MCAQNRIRILSIALPVQSAESISITDTNASDKSKKLTQNRSALSMWPLRAVHAIMNAQLAATPTHICYYFCIKFVKL